MPKLPQSIADLMRSEAYADQNHPSHNETNEKVEAYFKTTYPGKQKTDATGRGLTARTVWVWHAIIDDRTCETCEGFNDVVYETRDDIPKHPHHENCRCWIEEKTIDDNGDDVPDKKFDDIIVQTFANEGGYENDPRFIDRPTNIGITQKTLDNYNRNHPEYNFPSDVKDILPEQARQIYEEDYYRERHIDRIDDPRIAGAVFDMGVMSNWANVVKLVQKTLGGVAIDGIMGPQTLDALNSIDDIDGFMEDLIAARIGYLSGLPGWSKYGRGWTSRTNRY